MATIDTMAAAHHMVGSTCPSATDFEPCGDQGVLMGYTYADRHGYRGRRYGWVTVGGTMSQDTCPYRSIAEDMVTVAYERENPAPQKPAEEKDPYTVDFTDRSKTIAETVFWAAEEGKPLTLTMNGREMVMATPPEKVHVVSFDVFTSGAFTSEQKARDWVERNAAGMPRGVTAHRWTPESDPEGARLVHRFKSPETGRFNKSGYYVTAVALDQDD